MATNNNQPARNAFSIPASNASHSDAGWADAGGSSIINNQVKFPKFQIPKGRDFTGFRRGSR